MLFVALGDDEPCEQGGSARERGVVAVLGQRGHGVVDGAREQCFGHVHREQVNVLGRPVRQAVLANGARPA